MPLDPARAKVVEKLLSTPILAEDPQIAQDLEIVVKDMIELLGHHHPLSNDRLTLKRFLVCLLYTSPSPRDMRRSRMPSSA